MPAYHRTDAPWHKLDPQKIRRIKDLYDTGEYTHRQLGQMFGVNSSNITRAINDQSFQNFKELATGSPRTSLPCRRSRGHDAEI